MWDQAHSEPQHLTEIVWDAVREAAYRKHKFGTRLIHPQRRALARAAERLIRQDIKDELPPQFLDLDNKNSVRLSACLGPLALNDDERSARQQYLEGLCVEQRQRMKNIDTKRNKAKGKPEKRRPRPVRDERERRGGSAGDSMVSSST
jgi:hypothetical protein